MCTYGRCTLFFIKDIYQPLYHLEGGGAIVNILLVEMRIIRPSLEAKVRKAGTIRGPYGVDGAFVGFQVEELAGLFFIHPVLGRVLLQPFFGEFLGGLLKVGGNPFDISSRKSRCHFLAAVGAGQAIHILPYLFFNLRPYLVDAAGGFFFGLIQKATEYLALFCEFPFEGAEISLCNH